jgi:hypothetical protein
MIRLLRGINAFFMGVSSLSCGIRLVTARVGYYKAGLVSSPLSLSFALSFPLSPCAST